MQCDTSQELFVSLHPVVMRGKCASWRPHEYLQRFLKGDLRDTNARWRVTPVSCSKSMREHTSLSITGTFGEFEEWWSSSKQEQQQQQHQQRQASTFAMLPSREEGVVSLYADYLHIKELFDEEAAATAAAGGGGGEEEEHGKQGEHEAEAALASKAWAIDEWMREFGLDARDQTLWLSTYGAHTPLHYDAYGCNVVAQLSGKKRWQLWAKSTTMPAPLRVPYEESSIYSSHDPKSSSSSSSSLPPPNWDVLLEPGDMLFVPKHVWHFVSTESTDEMAFSVNVWLPAPDGSDSKDRLSEAITKFAFGAILDGLTQATAGSDFGHKKRGWISPSEERLGSSLSCLAQKVHGDGDDGDGDGGEEAEERNDLGEGVVKHAEHLAFVLQSLSAARAGRGVGADEATNTESLLKALVSELLSPENVNKITERLLAL